VRRRVRQRGPRIALDRKIAKRDDAHGSSVVDDGEEAQCLLTHELHRVLHIESASIVVSTRLQISPR